jgi:hypothetical protein
LTTSGVTEACMASIFSWQLWLRARYASSSGFTPARMMVMIALAFKSDDAAEDCRYKQGSEFMLAPFLQKISAPQIEPRFVEGKQPRPGWEGVLQRSNLAVVQ